ncbi:MAG: zinc-dependent peptidase [Actinomycetota bacterium]
MQRILAFRYRGAVPDDWRSPLDELPYLDTMTDDEVRRLVQLARMFESVVSFDGRHGFDVTDRVRRLICLEACRLVLALGYEPYRYVHRVTVAETTFVVETREGAMRVRGAAQHGGHVALSWSESEHGIARDDDGRNVIYHEFAHVLDGYDGVVDGRPDLDDAAADAAWDEAAGRSYRRLRKARGRRRRQMLIDKYGATSPVEFFSEATEVFFERPVALRDRDPHLYEAMAGYFEQDPATRRSG